MRVFITGINGLLGSALARNHKSRGHIVMGCDVDDRHGYCDIRDYQSLLLKLKVAKPDRVYHCAAMLGVQNTENHPDVCRDINERGTVCVVDACNVADVPEFVMLSSSEVYGRPRKNQPLQESSPLLGNNVYALGKIENENYVTARFRNKAVIVRMFNCYGVNQVKQFFVPKAIDLAKKGQPIQVYGHYGNTRSYLYSEDAAEYIRQVATNAPDGEVVNVAHYCPVTLGDLVKGIVTRTASSSKVELLRANYTDRMVSRDIPNRMADLTKLTRYTDHTPLSLWEGISAAITGYNTLKDDWFYKRTVKNYG